MIREIDKTSIGPIIVLDEKYLVKNFLSNEKRIRESIGMNIFNLTSGKSPLMIGYYENTAFSEFLGKYQPTNKLIDVNVLSPVQIDSIVADFVGNAYWSYKFKHKDKLDNFSEYKWAHRINKIYSEFINNKQLENYLGQKLYIKISKNLAKVLKDKSLNDNLTILHRDLHLGNILCQENSSSKEYNFKIIDFEHFMEGPLELEFQNSLFWNDKMSLNVKNIIEILSLYYRVPYRKDVERDMLFVYFAEQLNIATEMNDQKKITYLTEKFKQNYGK